MAAETIKLLLVQKEAANQHYPLYFLAKSMKERSQTIRVKLVSYEELSTASFAAFSPDVVLVDLKLLDYLGIIASKFSPYTYVNVINMYAYSLLSVDMLFKQLDTIKQLNPLEILAENNRDWQPKTALY